MPAKSILIVDDDPVIRDVIKSALNHGYFAIEASTFSEAMRFPSQSVNIAIIDYLLPDRDGFQVMMSLRDKMPGLPVIIMSGCGNDEVIIHALRNQATDYMKKPLDLKYLRHRVSEILGEDRERKDYPLSGQKAHNLDSIAEHIRKNYMEEMTLDTLARLACMSRYSFCRAFRERFDQCCISYLNSIRIQNAVKLLRDSRFSITEIAFSVGYRNSGHFNRVFKEAHKISPREYRQKMIASNQDVC
jgi:YesN/AraC family two-component response regulator